MSVRKFPMVVLALALVLSVACNKPAPPEPPKVEPPQPAVERPVEQPREVAKPVIDTGADKVQDPWAKDLQDVQDYAEKNDLLGTVFFEFDRSDLSPSARERLAKNARFLQERPEFIVTIEGHCDDRGTNEYNLALGERRANAALEYVTSIGVPSSRIRTISYGEERGACSDSSESCWAQNRKAFFRITGRV